ncbi:hypothetical protein GJ496_000582 [Pomphorhynchus laevis]|nr:hypothetical protein GJ496_000582 [Pomphorhynchus laevis]
MASEILIKLNTKPDCENDVHLINSVGDSAVSKFLEFVPCTKGTHGNPLQFVRTLSFQNVIIGDETLKYLRPAAFDRERASYIKTIHSAKVSDIRNFMMTTRFFGTRKLMFHVGEYELNYEEQTPKEVAANLKLLVVLAKTLIPQCQIFMSLQFPLYGCCVSRDKTKELNIAILALESEKFNVTCIRHDKIFLSPSGCFEDAYHLSQLKGTQLFAGSLKFGMRLHSLVENDLSSKSKISLLSSNSSGSSFIEQIGFSPTGPNATSFSSSQNETIENIDCELNKHSLLHADEQSPQYPLSA